jgi:hypothetical protein
MILPLWPTWVPRDILVPGGRLRLHPADLYALGPHRGGLDERWLASTTPANNGPATPPDEGLSYAQYQGERVLLRDLIGDWPVLCKLFDNACPIPFHLHPSDAQVASRGLRGKPEAYYFPPQYNSNPGPFPYSFLGLEPGVTPNDIRRCLTRWDQPDNGILDLSKAYRLRPGTGWQIDPGVLHAPGTLVTYEPQRASDTGAIFESQCNGYPLPWDVLVKDLPDHLRPDLDAILAWVDWNANTDPAFKRRFFRPPLPLNAHARWIVYGSPWFSAQELTVPPGQSLDCTDPVAYGALIVEGYGRFADFPAEAPTLIRYGQPTHDEFYVSAEAASSGVRITNLSPSQPLVILKHFGPNHPAAHDML